MKRVWQITAVVVALGLIGTATVLWLLEAPQTPPPAEPRQAVPAPLAASPPSAEPAASAPAIEHPLELGAAAEQQPLDVEAALNGLLGRTVVVSMLQLQDFPRRLVATVDNLGRGHAPVGLWPVNPAGGRFTVEEKNGIEVLSAENGLRYAPYVSLIEAVDMRKVVAVYRQLYPLLQKAYEDIGYPKRYFNDRLVQVIDLLLATPNVTSASAVHLPAINGPVQPLRPWVLYEFNDPALQSLSAGQKILLRMGPANERRVKVKLAELRRLVASGGLPR